jgi:transcription initiation factor TFIID subunit 1
MQAGNSFAEGSLPTKLKTKTTFDGNDIILVKKKNVPGKDGLKVSPEHDCHLQRSF